MRPPQLLLLLYLASIPAASHKILVYNLKFAVSHVNYLGQVADMLADAGHKVTTLMPEIVPSYKNGTNKSTIVTVPAAKEAFEAFKIVTDGNEDFFSTNFVNPLIVWQFGHICGKAFTAQCKATLDSGVIEGLRKQHFDVYIVETEDPCGMMLAHLIKPRSVILTLTTFIWQQQFDEIGLPRSLSFNPSVSTNKLNVNSFWSRLKNVVEDIYVSEANGPARRNIAALFKERYGADYPSLREQTSRVTYVFTNSEPLYDFATPTLSKIIHLPGLGAREPKPLDEYWSGVLAKRPRSVLISFGSIGNLQSMGAPFKQSFVKMFNAFPDVTFIVKYDHLEDDFASKELAKVENVVLTAWSPQNDLLNDPRLALFITHCGMGSVQELTLRGKPGVFIGLFGDQMRNSCMLETAGVGVQLPKAAVAEPEKFIGAVREAMENPTYASRALEIKAMLEGKPFKSKELLLKHVKFAGDFGDIAVTRPRSHDMTWIEYQNADVWLFIVATMVSLALLIIYLLISLVRCYCTKCCGRCKGSDDPSNQQLIYSVPSVVTRRNQYWPN